MTPEDETFLRHANQLAGNARQAGERPFGSLLVGPDGGVLAEDHNTVNGDNDITAHPELKLARWAAAELDPETAKATTMYTSASRAGCAPSRSNAPGWAGSCSPSPASSCGRTSTRRCRSFHPGCGTRAAALFSEARIPLDGFYT